MKTLANHVYYIGSTKQAADYQTMTDYIINYITKTFNFGNDSATALSKDEGKHYYMDQHKPKLQKVNISTTT
jgi:uncharacterized membrane protein